MDANQCTYRDRIEAWKQAAERREPTWKVIDFVTWLSHNARECQQRNQDPEPWRSLYQTALEVIQEWWRAQSMPLADLDGICTDEFAKPDLLGFVRDWPVRRLTPILVLRTDANGLKLLDGHHRLAIARERGESDILAIVIDETQWDFEP